MNENSPYPQPPKALIGKDNWLFLHNDTNHVVKQHTGEMLLSELGVQAWCSTLETRNNWLRNRSIDYFFLVPPDSHAVYPEFLPDDIHPAAIRPIFQVSQKLAQITDLQLIYPLDALKSKKSEMLVCHDTDSHWTHFGAYIAYVEVMQQIKNKYPNVRILSRDDITFYEEEFIGDLGNKFNPERKGTTVLGRINNPQAQLISDNGIVNRGNISVYENPDKSLPRAVFLRDSYGMWLSPFFAESFSHLTVVASPLMEYDIVESAQPDIVISETSERFFYQPPDDVNGEKAAELAAAKKLE